MDADDELKRYLERKEVVQMPCLPTAVKQDTEIAMSMSTISRGGAEMAGDIYIFPVWI